MPRIVGDAADAQLVGSVHAEHRIDAVIHFAGLKAVGESVADRSPTTGLTWAPR